MKENLLKAKMVEAGMLQAELASRLGISTPTLSKKLNGEFDFKLSEVQKLCDVLNIDSKARDNIFF